MYSRPNENGHSGVEHFVHFSEVVTLSDVECIVNGRVQAVCPCLLIVVFIISDCTVYTPLY